MSLRSCSAVEQTIISGILDRILENSDNLVGIFSEEDRVWDCNPTSDRAEIEEAIGGCDETELTIHGKITSGCTVRFGSILLIHGNDEDVLSFFSGPTEHADLLHFFADATLVMEPVS